MMRSFTTFSERFSPDSKRGTRYLFGGLLGMGMVLFADFFFPRPMSSVLEGVAGVLFPLCLLKSVALGRAALRSHGQEVAAKLVVGVAGLLLGGCLLIVLYVLLWAFA